MQLYYTNYTVATIFIIVYQDPIASYHYKYAYVIQIAIAIRSYHNYVPCEFIQLLVAN